jgi:ApaG protein
MSAAMSDTTTRGIRVQVESFYDEDRSSPQESYYFFAYQVRISNEGEERAQIISREWIITDANGEVQRVQGPGVVGEQPVLAPGEDFEYTSFCPLATPVGTMHGFYRMVRPDGSSFEAEIAPFSLAVPNAVN